MAAQRKVTVLRRKEIVAAARELIVRDGSENVTVRRLAEFVGFSEGALYKHFKSKKDILSLLVEDIEKALQADLEDSLARGDDALAILEQAINKLRERKGVSFQVIAEIISLGDKKLNREILEAVNAYLTTIKHVLAEGVRSGIIREDVDLDAAAVLYFGMVQGLVNIWSLSQYDFDLKARYTPSWALFRRAIAKS